jgi:hypothetical protein
LVLISVILISGDVGFSVLVRGLIYASISAILCWFMGFIIIDIVVKGIITNIDDRSIDAMIDGGLLQRVRMMQEQLVPGGMEMPFVNRVKPKTVSDVKNKNR